MLVKTVVVWRVLIECRNNYRRAFKHFLIGARAGHKGCLEYVKMGYEKGIITKNGYEKALRSYHKRQNEMKSDERDKAAATRVSEHATFGATNGFY